MLLGRAAKTRVPQGVGMEIDLLVIGESCVGLGGDGPQGGINVLTCQALAGPGAEQRTRPPAAYVIQIRVEGFPGLAGDEHRTGDLAALTLHVEEVLVLILVEIQPKQLGNPHPRPQQHLEDGPIPDGVLVLPPLQVHELLGGGLEPGDLDVCEPLPFGVIHADVSDPLGRVAGQERSAVVNPPGTVPQGGENPVDRGGAAFFVLELLDEVAGDGPGPLVGVVAAGRLAEEIEECVQVPGLGLDGILGVRPGLQTHVQVEPRDEAVPLSGADGVLRGRSPGHDLGSNHGRIITQLLMSRKPFRFQPRFAPVSRVQTAMSRVIRYIMTCYQHTPSTHRARVAERCGDNQREASFTSADSASWQLTYVPSSSRVETRVGLRWPRSG